jgi:hypothetical protein
MIDRSTDLLALLVAGLCALAAALPAHAQTGPVIAIPTRPGIPIVINGWDASYAIVEGDWGLARPSIGIAVIGGGPVLPNPVYEPRRHYHPRYGRPPARGRFEVEPAFDQPLPEPAAPFRRSWSTSSQPQPVYGEPAPRMRYNPADVPATIIDPQTFPPEFYPEGFVPPPRRFRQWNPPP